MPNLKVRIYPNLHFLLKLVKTDGVDLFLMSECWSNSTFHLYDLSQAKHLEHFPGFLQTFLFYTRQTNPLH